MTGYLLTCAGETWQLPPLLSWEVQRTDGAPCDSASVTFLFEPGRLGELKSATRLRLTRDGQTAFFGVIDEFEAAVGSGRRVTITARSLAALLMDNELRAVTYSVLTKESALADFARPFGVAKTEADALPAVRNFTVETGTSAWQALCGFCRHSAELQPRFAADGTLLLRRRTPQRWSLGADCGFVSAVYRQRRYGVISKQTIVNARGAAETAENAAFQKLGGLACKVAARSGSTLHARWRTAKQRVEESCRGAVTLTVTLTGGFSAEPGDLVQVTLPQAGVSGSFTLRAITDRCAGSAHVCELEMEGTLG